MREITTASEGDDCGIERGEVDRLRRRRIGRGSRRRRVNRRFG